MNQEKYLKGSPQERVEIALDAIKAGNGVIVTDDESKWHFSFVKEVESYAYA